MNSSANPVKRFLSRLPLAAQMLALTALMSGAAWLGLDLVQSKKIREIFTSELRQRLEEKAHMDRIHFDAYVEGYRSTAVVIASQGAVRERAGERDFQRPRDVQRHTDAPPWLPPPAVLRAMPRATYAVLFDGRGRAKEVYQDSDAPPPPSLVDPDPLLMSKSLGQSFMTNIDGAPYVLASQEVRGRGGELLATLLVASPIDDEFVVKAMGFELDTVVALFDRYTLRSFATNRPDLIMPGATLDELKKGFIVTGKSHFDQGSSDLLVQFTSLISRKEFASLSEAVLSTERRQRAVAAAVLIGCFVLAMLVVIGRIKALTNAVTDFSGTALGVAPRDLGRGDELGTLEKAFGYLTGAVSRKKDELEQMVEGRTAELRREIAERERAEDGLARSERHLRAIIENEPECVKLIAEDGTLLTMNPAGVAMVEGEDAGQVVGRSFVEIVAPEHRERVGAFLKAVCSGQRGTLQYEIVGLKGSRRWMDAHGVPFYSAEGERPVALMVTRDVTERYKLEQQLLQSQKMEAIGKLTSGIAHDFNNILTAIMGYGEMLQSGLRQGDPLRPPVDIIMSAAGKGAGLVQSLLAFSREQITRPRAVDINKVVLDSEKLLRSLVGEGVALRITAPPAELVAMADSLQLEQVLMNLATNAKDAMPGGGTITITTRAAELDAEFVKASGYGRPGPHCLIAFSDTGAGMDEKTKARIFEPFFTTKELGKGTGLGLSVVYGIVRQHNGFINVYSEPGMGSTFKIYLPLVKAPAEPEPARAERREPKGGGETILLAEDSKDIRDLLKTAIEGGGYKVIAAEDGEEAIAAFRAHKDEIALLLLDVVMPKADGRKVLEEARKDSPGVRAILMSGYAGEILGEADLKKEGVAFVQKPLHLKDVLSTIREALDRARPVGVSNRN